MKELIKIQVELKAPKNQRNNFGKYNYRSCEDILEAVKPLLNANKCTLFISDEIKEAAGSAYVEASAVITNESGETIKVSASAGIDFNRKGMDISQSFGSSSSYARKYALNGLFLIDDTKDADATETHGKAEPTAVKKQPLSDERFANALKQIKEGTIDFSILQKFELTKKQKDEAAKI